MMDRIIGAFTFREGVYAEVEHDTSFTSTAWTIVVVTAVLSQLGSYASLGFGNLVGWLGAAVVGTVFAVIGFAVAAAVVSAIGKAAFNAEVTFDEMVRTLGLAYVWQAVGVLGVLAAIGPALACILGPAQLVAAIAGLVAWFRAAKEALDLEWLQVIITVVIAFVVLLIVGGIATLVTAALGFGASAIGGVLGS